MPSLQETAPASIQADKIALNQALDQVIPPRIIDKNLLIATWNLRAFSSLTEKWIADDNDSPKRDLAGLLYICEIIKRFDVIAIQEVKGDLKALRHALQYLGDNWSFIMTDISLGDKGNSERLAFLFDTRRIKLSGLACELVVPEDILQDISPNALNEQFSRTPYAVSFKIGKTTFILVTLHVTYANTADGRIPELQGIAQWMADWASNLNRWNHNLLAMGDFNIDRKDSPLWQAFTSTGLSAPADLDKVMRTLFSDPQNPELDKFYDQIAWFHSGDAELIEMNYRQGGSFDFLPYVYSGQGFSKNTVSYRVSDHYPLWVEFGI